MKRAMRKITSILLTIVIIAGFLVSMPMGVQASFSSADPAASIGTTDYHTIALALAAAQNGDTIILKDDVQESVVYMVTPDKIITIDGATHGLVGENTSGTGSFAMKLTGKGSITLKDITLHGGNATGDNSAGLVVAGSVNVSCTGTVEAIGGSGHLSEGLRIENTGKGTVTVSSATGGIATTADSRGVANYGSGTVNVTTAEGGNAVTNSMGVYNYGSGTVNVTTATGGEASDNSGASIGVQNYGLGTVNVGDATGGTAPNMSVGVNGIGGTINVTGTAIGGDGSIRFSYGVYNEGSSNIIVNTAQGGSSLVSSYGVYNFGPGTIRVTTATGGTANNDLDSKSSGVYSNDASGVVNAGSANGGTTTGESTGVHNDYGVVNVNSATAGTADGNCYGVYVWNGVINVDTAKAGTVTGAGDCYGVFMPPDASPRATVNVNSIIGGSYGNTINTTSGSSLSLLNRDAGTSCVLDAIPIAAFGATGIGVLPTVTKAGHTYAWFSDPGLTIFFTDETVDVSTAVYSGEVYSISGKITGSNKPYGVSATLQLKQGGSIVGAPVTALGDGTYTIGNVLPGSYAIEVAGAGYDVGTIAAVDVVNSNVTGEDLTLQLQPLTVGTGGNYSTISDALQYVGDGDTITLLSDITESVSYRVISDETITIDGQNHTITGTNGTALYIDNYEGGVINLKNLTLQGDNSGQSNGLRVENGDVSIRSIGTVNAIGGSNNSFDSGGVYFNSTGTLDITSATGGNNVQNSYGVCNASSGTVNVNMATGGDIPSNSSYGVVNNTGVVNVDTATGGRADYSYGVYLGDTGRVNVNAASAGIGNTESYGIYFDAAATVNAGTVTGAVHRYTGDTYNTNTDVITLTLNKGTGSCVLSAITIAAMGDTELGALPVVSQNGTVGDWYTINDLQPSHRFTGSIINPSTVNELYSTFYTQPITTGSIEVTVTDGSNPVTGADISVSGSVYSTVENNGVYTISNVPAGTYTVTASKTGYNSGSASNVTVTANTTTSGISITLSAIPASYTVTFNKNGGDTDASPTTKTAVSGGNVGTLPTAPTRAGYNFVGWYSNTGGTGEQFTAATAVTGNITVYAKWTASHASGDTSTGGNGGSGGGGSTATTPATPTVPATPPTTYTPIDAGAAVKLLQEGIKDLDTITDPAKAVDTAKTLITSVIRALRVHERSGQVTEAVKAVAEKIMEKVSVEKVSAIMTADLAAVTINETTSKEIITRIDTIISTANQLNAIVDNIGADVRVPKVLKIEAAVDVRAKQAEVEFPATILAAAADKKIDKISIDAGIATISIAPEAITTNGSEKVELSAWVVNKETLPEDVKTAVGDNQVYDFTMIVGTNRISKFKKPMEIGLPYTLKAGENPKKVTVFYISDMGQLENFIGKYDEKTGKVYFATNHFSYYYTKVNSITFTDVDSSNWAKDFIETMASKGVLGGTGSGKFSPAANLTRAEFAAMVVRAFKLNYDTVTSKFKDVKTSDWFYKEVSSAVKAGIVSGRPDGTFAPNENISRQDMAVIVNNVLTKIKEKAQVTDADMFIGKFGDSSTIGSYAKAAAAMAYKYSIITGKPGNLFAPKDMATRAEAAKIIYTVFNVE